MEQTIESPAMQMLQSWQAIEPERAALAEAAMLEKQARNMLVKASNLRTTALLWRVQRERDEEEGD